MAEFVDQGAEGMWAVGLNGERGSAGRERGEGDGVCGVGSECQNSGEPTSGFSFYFGLRFLSSRPLNCLISFISIERSQSPQPY